jgi:hypothetical protein
MNGSRIVQTTLGNLIEALTEEASVYARDEKETYQVVAVMLMHLLNNGTVRTSRYAH